jgi:hypothetical protein
MALLEAKCQLENSHLPYNIIDLQLTMQSVPITNNVGS